MTVPGFQPAPLLISIWALVRGKIPALHRWRNLFARPLPQ
jgi:hypothetical protein